MTPDHTAAHASLTGLATADALGAQHFVPAHLPALRERRLPPAPWPWTDDTEMACALLAALPADRADLDQDALARSFAERHDFDRGYGPAMNRLLRQVREGGDWRTLAAGLFDGQGSWGNGAAMRVAPLGAYYAADPALAAHQAARSAEVTHTHPLAVAGAVAVAVAAALATVPGLTGRELLAGTVELTPPGRLRETLREARMLLDQPYPGLAAHRLGNGRQVSALDTVPWALWCAARHLDDYPAALWTCAAAGGDVDTTCAITGGVVAARTGPAGIPTPWRTATEPLPIWLPTRPEPC
ncbi:ADP-ribosylglycohydrolase family protein [Kitasatospora sp. NPDC049285]|uniref:ADP-ribosylglycohydrolase family protein n=1 Tax=Kitasatospora sp. NPDC049285 TaxID=3157096 RepID=UPI00341E0B4A